MQMDKTLKEFIINKKHRALRRKLSVELAEDFSRRALSPIQRMTERFSLKSVLLFLKTNRRKVK